ncbi:FAD-dependent oxidoreductase [Diaphorobacter sp. HDW4B]|uniref:FAD-dependent oxidoreductase n=1 Tax=Diaphorobacter sp. HDW4B TaxID=2714925 RepID=UPI00140B02FB|nr:FAD-dependent oxidoreductase [Diaphorobacter sp. HDW4B]QIL68966.1 FAD-dependent oxidoreductase [Diaphorobacter sp. HDW4B]
MLPLQKNSTITILGAGLMGRLLAVELARKGHRVEVFEAQGPDAQGAAARVAAAMLAPLAESAVTEPGVVRMGQYALPRWQELIGQLSTPVFFQQNGTLILWHRLDAGEAQRFQHKLTQTQQQIPELQPLQMLNGAQVDALEPSVATRFANGMYLPGEGQLDNRQLLAALEVAMTELGVKVHWNAPKQPEDITPGSADMVLDCRGLGAKPTWNALRGVRGEVVRLYAPEVTLERPTRLVHPRYPIYIAPKENHLFVIGATEIESDDMSPASVRSTLELLSAAYAVHSGFAEARILEIATQCRPTLPDNLPAVRQVRKNVLEVNGLYRHGFMISPAMLDVVMEVLETGQSTLAPRFDLSVQID